MDDPHKDLRSLGDRMFDKRDLPVAEGTEAQRPAAAMIRPRSFYFAQDTGVLWYSDGATWTAASNAFGPKIYNATTGGESHFTRTSYGDPNVSGSAGPTISGLADGTYLLQWGGSATGDGTSGGDASFMAVQANGGALTGDLECQLQGVHASVSRSDVLTVANSNNNTFRVVYKTQLGHDADARYRWLVAIKYA